MRWLRPCVEGWSIYSPLGSVLQRQLRELRPDCVYALLGNYYMTRLVYTACQQLDIPLFVHVTDDFVTSLYKDLPLAGRLQKASDQWFRRAVQYASGLAAISPIMADEFESRYGKPWSWFTTLIDADEYRPEPRSADGTVRFVFAGNLGLQRWRTLRELALALRGLQMNHGLESRLAIYTSYDQLDQHRAALDIRPVTQLEGWRSPDQLPAIFRDADVLVHVESFDPAVADYTKLSFSTKLSQYMMAGRCVLAIGPESLASMQIIGREGAGALIHSASAAEMADPLAALISSVSRREECGRKGRRWAEQWMNRPRASLRFQQQIIAAIERHHRRSSIH